MKYKIVLFDADGVATSAKKFSVDLEKDFGITPAQLLPFFKGPFQDCLTGKADLKIAIESYLKDWDWRGSADEFLAYWFESEDEVNQVIIDSIRELRSNGIKCYLATNQEKYRAKYMHERMDFKNVFDEIFSSADLGCKKPSPLFFELLFTRISENDKIQKDEVLFWDDSLANVEAARLFGFHAHQYTDDPSFEKIMSQES